MTAPDLDVVIPTWNRADLLLACLGSLAGQDRAHTVWVVDNGSADGTAEAVAARHPDVRLVRLETNLGFGRAVNAGVAAGSAPLVVLLNNDTLAPPTLLSALVAPLEADPSLHSVAGVLVEEDGVTIDAAGVEVDRTLAGYSWAHGLPLGRLPRSEPLGPCGGAAAYRREALADLGGFDPEIFAYGEDVDLALRGRLLGHRCAVAPDAVVGHRGGATLGKGSVAQLRHSGWSRGYLLGRWRAPAWAVLLELVLAVGEGLRRRSPVPVAVRVRGWRRGRALPGRAWSPALATVPLRDGLRRRVRG